MFARAFRHPLLLRFLLSSWLGMLAPLLALGQTGSTAPAFIVHCAKGDLPVSHADLQKLASVSQSLAPPPNSAGQARSMRGPLLWSVLTAVGAVDESRHRDHVRLTLLVKGRDGYAARLALAEISPEFNGKPVIVATGAGDASFADGGVRLVVPGEVRAGRSVRDVVEMVLEHEQER
ncbi:MAG: hypothetical protein K2P80_10200 [Beijerinckiaceae bacterium]|nr:hypothetical protein [Beijerinckiaceae bacterium]